MDTTKQPASDRVHRWVAMLNKLINDPRAPEGERRMAELRLAKLHRKYDISTGPAPSAPAWLSSPDVWIGERYAETKNLSSKDVAKLIRQEISLARKIGRKTAKDGEIATPDPIGDAPREVKISVRSPHPGTIEIILRGIPDDWGWVPGRHHGEEKPVPSPALCTLVDELGRIHQQYNYDGSDIMTDLFLRRYGGGVYRENEYGGISGILTRGFQYI